MTDLHNLKEAACAFMGSLLLAALPVLRMFQDGDSHFDAHPFIAAFTLSADTNFKFVWPHPDMPPHQGKTILILIGPMPQMRAKNEGEWLPVKAAQVLTVNSRPPKPLRARGVRPPPGGELFLAELERGRLRLQLSIPEGYVLDPRHKTVSVKLYEPVFH